MSSLPLLSHHLFVAAVQDQGRARPQPARPERPLPPLSTPASGIALEVLDRAKAMPANAVRPLRASLSQS